MISNALQDQEILCDYPYDIGRCSAPASYYYRFIVGPMFVGCIEARCSSHHIQYSSQAYSITEAEYLVRSVMES